MAGDDLELVLPVSLVRADTPEGPRDYVVLATHEDAFAAGLRAEIIVGALSRPFDPARGIAPEDFTAGHAFLQRMHEVIARHGAMLEGTRAEAARLGRGHVYVIDRRTPAPGVRVPTEDLVGAFEVQDGELAGYVPNERYRVLTAHGFPQLGELLPALLEDFARVGGS